jgi:hypothetical protein
MTTPKAPHIKENEADAVANATPLDAVAALAVQANRKAASQ